MESPEPLEPAEPAEPPEPAAPSEPADPPLPAAERHFRTVGIRLQTVLCTRPCWSSCAYLDEDDWAVTVEPLATEAE